jgi:[ribosomal protein S5]-alanine N-acetyltransferase
VINNKIITERLVLIPATYNIILSLLRKETQEIEKLGLKVNQNWPTADTYDVLNFFAQTMNETQVFTGFDTTWMIIKKDNLEIVGDAGFKGNPNEKGEVEIGYGIVDEEQRKGYGFEAVQVLIKWGFDHKNVNVIKAECLKENIGSIRILQKIGMDEVARNNEFIFWKSEKSVHERVF